MIMVDIIILIILIKHNQYLKNYENAIDVGFYEDGTINNFGLINFE